MRRLAKDQRGWDGDVVWTTKRLGPVLRVTFLGSSFMWRQFGEGGTKANVPDLRLLEEGKKERERETGGK